MTTLQPIYQTATSDGSGNITWPRFQPPPAGTILQGTVNVPGAPIAALFNVVMNGITIGTFNGYNPWGPIQARSGDIIQITGSGLANNTVYQVVWMAGSYAEGTAPAPPIPYGSITQISNSQTNPVVVDVANTTSNPVIVQVLQLPAPPAAMNFSIVITATGSGQQVSVASVPLTVGLAFLADPANAQNFHIGASSVSATSAYVAAGQGIVIPISNANIIYVLGTSGDKLSVWGA